MPPGAGRGPGESSVAAAGSAVELRPMSAVGKLWFGVVVAVLAVVAVVQIHDAVVWARAPWPGFTLSDYGRVSYRHTAETPPAIRPYLADHDLRILAVRAGGEWVDLQQRGDR